jgi:protein gp37
MALSKTKIDYLTHCWNFQTGCNHWKNPGICPVGEACWAKILAENPFFRGKKGNFEPTLHPEKLLDPLKGKQGGRRIGVCFTGDLFGDWVDPEKLIPLFKINTTYLPLREMIFNQVIQSCPQHQFFFLTKAPQNLVKWGRFPDNAWVGATVCNQEMLHKAICHLSGIEAKNKWISFEPLKEQLIEDNQVVEFASLLRRSGISWVVIGGWSGGKNPPKIEWVSEIKNACKKADIPVFLKDNLNKVPNIHDSKTYAECSNLFSIGVDYAFNLRQELPEVKG